MIVIMSSEFISHLEMLPSRVRNFAAGELLFEREDPVTSFFLVETGSVHLLRRQLDGAEFILQRAEAGAILGEASLFSETYHCAAVAVSACQLRIFSAKQVKNLIADNGTVALAYAVHLGLQLRNARLRAEIVSLRRVADRLDAWLAWHENLDPEKGTWNRVAREIGVSPEALYRELARRRTNR